MVAGLALGVGVLLRGFARRLRSGVALVLGTGRSLAAADWSPTSMIERNSPAASIATSAKNPESAARIT